MEQNDQPRRAGIAVREVSSCPRHTRSSDRRHALLALTVAVVAVLAGCAVPASKEAVPVGKEAPKDWPAFIASVPGDAITDTAYKTPTLKRSSYSAFSREISKIRESFGSWCKAKGGVATNMPPTQGGGVALSFDRAASAWSKQVLETLGVYFHVPAMYCHDTNTQLVAVMLIRTMGGNRLAASEPPPAPVIAFYTADQAALFADYYNTKEKERSAALSKDRWDRQAAESLRLQTTPKIGDQTIDGIIVDLRPPLALIQYNARLRQMFGKPQAEWVPISSLTAPR